MRSQPMTVVRPHAALGGAFGSHMHIKDLNGQGCVLFTCSIDQSGLGFAGGYFCVVHFFSFRKIRNLKKRERINLCPL